MKFIAPILCSCLICSCADSYYRQGVSTDANGNSRAVAVKAFQKYSKTIGPGRVIVTDNTIIHEWFDPSPNAPRQVSSAFDPKTGITYTTETPIVAQSDPSASTMASGNAANRMMHGLSNIAGTVLTGFAGIGAARALPTP